MADLALSPHLLHAGVDCYRREARFCSGDNRDATYSKCRLHTGGSNKLSIQVW